MNRAIKIALGLGLAVGLPIGIYVSGSALRTRLRQVRISGLVKAGPKALSGYGLTFSLVGSKKQQRAISDERGSYSVTLEQAGAYTVAFMPLPYLPVGTADVNIQHSGESLTFDLPDTAIQVSVAATSGDHKLWQLHMAKLSSPGGDTTGATVLGLIRKSELGRPIRGLAPGSWHVSVDTTPDETSETANLEVRQGEVDRITLATNRGSGDLRLVDSEGRPVIDATVGSDGRALNNRGGSVELRRVAPGASLIVSGKGFLPTCVRAPSRMEEKSVHLRPEGGVTKELELTGAGAKWPLGALQSSSDECRVPAKWYRFEIIAKAAGDVHVRLPGLDRGTYTYFLQTPDSHLESASLDDAAVLRAPEGCGDCSMGFPVRVLRSSAERR